MGSKYTKYDDDDISMEEWMQQMDTVFEAYVREVANIRQAIKALRQDVVDTHTRMDKIEAEWTIASNTGAEEDLE